MSFEFEYDSQQNSGVSKMFVKACPMLTARAHACARMQQLQQSQQLQQQSSSQRVGALSLIPSCSGISGAVGGASQYKPNRSKSTSTYI